MISRLWDPHTVAVGFVLSAIVFTGAARSPAGVQPEVPQKTPEFMRTAAGICPQKRKTRRAPRRYLKKINPLKDTEANLKQGEALYNKDAKPTACRLCHGVRGTGNGKLAMPLDPPPRNFTCAENMQGISDGQLFWIIANGSKGTGMPAHDRTLTDREIWQLILYIRRFSR